MEGLQYMKIYFFLNTYSIETDLTDIFLDSWQNFRKVCTHYTKTGFFTYCIYFAVILFMVILTHGKLKGKYFSICQLYYPKVSKQNNYNFSDWRFFPFATGVNDTEVAPEAANISKNSLSPFLKGTVPLDFRLQVFFLNQFPPSRKSSGTVPLKERRKWERKGENVSSDLEADAEWEGKGDNDKSPWDGGE